MTARAATLLRQSRRVVCLVDFFNVVPRIREPGDVDDALNTIFSALRASIGRAPSEIVELEIRLYGGWVTSAQSHSQVATWLLQAIARARGLHAGFRILPVCALTLAELPHISLVGTIRDRGQKMVDTMLCLDILHFSDSGSRLVVMSDDDDMVPAVLVAASRGPRELRLLRRRPLGVGQNDHCFSATKYSVQVQTY